MGYACDNRVLTQYKNPGSDPDKIFFNAIITKARGRVERAIGALKERCSSLSAGIRARNIKRQSEEILACAVLHQYCRWEEIKSSSFEEYIGLDHTPDPNYENLTTPQIRQYLTRKWAQGRGISVSNTVTL